MSSTESPGQKGWNPESALMRDMAAEVEALGVEAFAAKYGLPGADKRTLGLMKAGTFRPVVIEAFYAARVGQRGSDDQSETIQLLRNRIKQLELRPVTGGQVGQTAPARTDWAHANSGEASRREEARKGIAGSWADPGPKKA